MKGIDPSKAIIRAATIDITEDCNLRCDYCFTGGKARKTLDIQTGKDAIDFLLRPDVSGKDSVDITFFGGEPLMRFDLIKELVIYGETAAKVAGKRISFGATTNGCLLNKEIIEFWKAHNMGFLLSIDGDKVSQDAHRKTVGGGSSFEQITANIPFLLKHYPSVTARMTLSLETAPYIAHDVEWLYSQGFQSVAITPVQECEWDEEHLQMVRDGYDAAVDIYLNHWRKGRKVSLKAFNDVFKEWMNPPGANSHPCGAGRGYVGINTEGYIYPCHRFNQFEDERPAKEQPWCLGSIYEGIWNEEKRNLFIDFPRLRAEHSPACNSCEIFGTRCTGGCYAVAWATSGQESIFKQPDSTFEFRKIELAMAQKVKDAMVAEGLGMELFEKPKMFEVSTPGCPKDTCVSCHAVSNMDGHKGEVKPEYAPFVSPEHVAAERKVLGIVDSPAPAHVATVPPDASSAEDRLPMELEFLRTAQDIIADSIADKEILRDVLAELREIKTMLKKQSCGGLKCA